jgi:hypothetical protein
MNLTFETLVAAIRNGAATDELKRMVGPSNEEIAAAKDRLSRLDALDEKCEWESTSPSVGAQQARDRRGPIVREQSAYEQAYC